MGMYRLLLPGWDALSTWGLDHDYFFAQLTRNGHSEDKRPRRLDYAAPLSGVPVRSRAGPGDQSGHQRRRAHCPASDVGRRRAAGPPSSRAVG